jgi:hypothetical protein
MGDHCGNIIRVDSVVMHGTFPGFPRRLIVKIDVAGSDAYQDIAHSGNNFIKQDRRAKHFTIKSDALIEIGCKEMDMMKIAMH